MLALSISCTEHGKWKKDFSKSAAWSVEACLACAAWSRCDRGEHLLYGTRGTRKACLYGTVEVPCLSDIIRQQDRNSTNLLFNEVAHMQAEEILTQAKASTELPHGWVIFPLLRQKVRLAIFGWAFGILMGLGLFAMVASAVIPDNYQRGFASALFTTLLLGIFLFIGLGSLWALIMDVQRLLQADKHVLVLTPEDFVKQEGDKIVHVPCINIRHVTARGTPHLIVQPLKKARSARSLE